MNLLIKNIKTLVQTLDNTDKPLAGKAMDKLQTIDNAYLFIKDGKIEDFGSMDNLPSVIAKQIDVKGKMVFPSFVDSHTHIVFAESREKEFEMRIKGMSYEEIARKGGGILNSAAKLQNASFENLYESAKKRLFEVISMGTGVIEIKSGYGLTLESELKMLRVIRELKKISPIPIKATFLGAHAIPVEYREKREEYVDLIIKKMIPAVAQEELAEYIDVFCDRGFFTKQETVEILKAGRAYGMKAKIHANELDYTGGIQAGVECNAISVDHLECTGDEEIKALLSSDTIPTILPATAFFLGMEYPPVRKMIDAGLAVALASDYNPGSCPSGNMSFIVSLGCIKLKMTAEEAINAATHNAAHALELGGKYGVIKKGNQANLFITSEIPSYAFIPYAFGNSHIETIILNGEIWEGS